MYLQLHAYNYVSTCIELCSFGSFKVAIYLFAWKPLLGVGEETFFFKLASWSIYVRAYIRRNKSEIPIQFHYVVYRRSSIRENLFYLVVITSQVMITLCVYKGSQNNYLYQNKRLFIVPVSACKSLIHILLHGKVLGESRHDDRRLTWDSTKWFNLYDFFVKIASSPYISKPIRLWLGSLVATCLQCNTYNNVATACKTVVNTRLSRGI